MPIFNALQRAGLRYNEAESLGLFAHLPQLLTSDVLASARGLGAESAAPIFIVGMPRSGTSLAEQILASHPAVFGAGEIAFWDDAFAAHDPHGWTEEARANAIKAIAEQYFARTAQASAEALRGTTGVDDYGEGLKRLSEHVSGFLAITDGPEGIYWLERKTVRHMPAFKVKAIDSLGAGDAFHGAFTLALAEGRDLDAAMRFASATAALKCTKFGGASGAPTRAEVDAFLKRQGG